MQLIVEQLLNKQVFKDASVRNIQAHIVASLITHQFREHEQSQNTSEANLEAFSQIMEPVTEKITE